MVDDSSTAMEELIRLAHAEEPLCTLLLFRYRYQILVSVAVTKSGTVRVLNGTQYLQYLILTSRSRISVDGCWYRVLLRYPIPISAKENFLKGANIDIGYRHPAILISQIESILSTL